MKGKHMSDREMDVDSAWTRLHGATTDLFKLFELRSNDRRASNAPDTISDSQVAEEIATMQVVLKELKRLFPADYEEMERRKEQERGV